MSLYSNEYHIFFSVYSRIRSQNFRPPSISDRIGKKRAVASSKWCLCRRKEIIIWCWDRWLIGKHPSLLKTFPDFQFSEFFFKRVFLETTFCRFARLVNRKVMNQSLLNLNVYFFYGITKNMNKLLGWYHNLKGIFYCKINEKKWWKSGIYFETPVNTSIFEFFTRN